MQNYHQFVICETVFAKLQVTCDTNFGCRDFAENILLRTGFQLVERFGTLWDGSLRIIFYFCRICIKFGLDNEQIIPTKLGTVYNEQIFVNRSRWLDAPVCLIKIELLVGNNEYCTSNAIPEKNIEKIFFEPVEFYQISIAWL